MSVEAITWALKQPIHPSSAKFVLLVLANCSNADSMEAYPSVAYLANATSQDRKTVLANIKRLTEMGYIEDTGRRRGNTNQIIVYRLRNPQTALDKSAEFGTLETVPNFPDNSTVFPGEQYQNSLETVPKTGHGTVIKTKRETKGKHSIVNFTPTFEEAWKAYPPAIGASKPAAFAAWKARVKEGFDETEMLNGAMAYAAFIKFRKTDPQYIKQPKNFFGTELLFKSDWSFRPTSSSNKNESVAEHNERVTAEVLRRHGLRSDDDGMTIDMVQ